MTQVGDEHTGYTREEQSELFAEFQTSKPEKPSYSFRKGMVFGKKFTLNLSYENIVLLVIVLIMLLVIFFSLGVEKGKRINTVETGREIEEELVFEIPEVKEMEIIIEEAKVIEEKVIEVVQKPRPYTIQVIAFKNEKKANKEIALLKNKGYETFIISSNEWLQVCVGQYANREELYKDFDALKNNYPTCYVRKIRK